MCPKEQSEVERAREPTSTSSSHDDDEDEEGHALALFSQLAAAQELHALLDAFVHSAAPDQVRWTHLASPSSCRSPPAQTLARNSSHSPSSTEVEPRAAITDSRAHRRPTLTAASSRLVDLEPPHPVIYAGQPLDEASVDRLLRRHNMTTTFISRACATGTASSGHLGHPSPGGGLVLVQLADFLDLALVRRSSLAPYLFTP